MTKQAIVVRGARQHNLKNIDLEIPRRQFVVITGPSGSGKSSLAFDTIYAEGQRRYVESLSTYAKQFLDRMEKPDVDRVDGISPSVAIEQSNPTKTSRSTVGTATEVHDYLRLLWARVGKTICPGTSDDPCGRVIQPDTVQSATDRVLTLPPATRVMIAFPLPRSARVTHALIVENLRALGFSRVLTDGRELHLDEIPEGIDLAASDPFVLVDRLRVDAEERSRLADSLQTAFQEGDGDATVFVVRSEGTLERLDFTERFRCPRHPELQFPAPTPQLFSFNNPYGSCPECTGFGAVLTYDPSLIVPNPSRTLAEGAVDPWDKPRYEARREKLAEFARVKKVSMDTPWNDLPETFRRMVIEGTKGFEGVIPFLRALEEKRYKQYIRVFLRQYQSALPCAVCGGSRLRPEALRVQVAGSSIAEVSGLPLKEMDVWLKALGCPNLDESSNTPATEARAVSERDLEIADTILRELRARVGFLNDVGVGYLTLDRQTRTLSGGEAQRISLANALGGTLVDTIYVLDEPTIGLHPADTDRLLSLLLRLRDGGNSVLVVEHDPAAMLIADHLVELGPGSGERGGQLVFTGTLEEMLAADTLTGRYLSGAEQIPVAERQSLNGIPWVRVNGAREHNLHGIDARFPLRAMTVVTGVSGSGKSTLVHDVIYRAIEQSLSGGETSAKRHLGEAVGKVDSITGLDRIKEVVLVDQSPIGRTPRSNPVSYIKAYDEIRRIFAALPESRRRGYTAGDFSFNVEGGRCEACKGDGQVEVEMVFMADVLVPCEICGGSRFKPEILEIVYRGRGTTRPEGANISEVLAMTVDEAIRFFLQEDRLGQALWHLQQVGLGYLRLGQPAPTLSGGEAQRIKIARELALGARRGGHKLYILDEPTTGLHMDDVRKLLVVLRDLVDAGHAVLLIEHNLDVIRAADWVIDLGPGAGPDGGRVVAMGTPEEIRENPLSLTGQALVRDQERSNRRTSTSLL
ncbi:MAG: excinuclease ABC subunit UvrA [Gemmatimonadota bacterium]|jgi:excinuclease ABC subunit A|nr:excinuclease ABC subunit UvrA [Gemmatimonadota bacterium]